MQGDRRERVDVVGCDLAGERFAEGDRGGSIQRVPLR